MALVNADTLIQLPGGQWIAASLAGPVQNGKVNVNNDTVIRLPGGGTMVAGAIGMDATFSTQPLPTTTKTPQTTAPFNGDAFAQLRSYLTQYGLDSLTDTVRGWIEEGISPNEAILRLYQTPEFKAQFPEIEAYRNAGHSGALTPAAIVDYRTKLEQEVSSRGLKEAFPDIRKTAFDYMVANKSLGEVQSRLDLIEGNVAALAANDPQTQADMEAWQRYYGVKPTLANLVSLAINPQEAVPALQRKFASVKFDTIAGQAGFGDLSQAEATRLVDQGVTADQAQAGFSALSTSQELNVALNSSEQAISRQDQLAAVANDTAARMRRQAKAQQRVAAFSGGGQLATSRDGLAGLSTAS